MHAKPVYVIDRIFKPGKKNWAAQFAIFILAMLPVVILATISYTRLSDELTKSALERRGALTELAGKNVEQHFDSLLQLGTSLANRPLVVEGIEKNDWDGAMRVLENTPRVFPFIDRVFLADLNGVLKSDFPHAQNVVGQNFSERDWYKGVSKNWTPYVSEVYVRAAEPKEIVVAAAIPVVAPDGKKLGILVAQVDFTSLFGWTTEVTVGEGGRIFIIDRFGHVMSHPKLLANKEVFDFSNFPVVRAARESTSGIGIFHDPIDNASRLISYWRSPKYGFLTAIQEPTESVFLTRNHILKNILLIYAFVFLLNFVLAWLLWSLVRLLVSQHQKEEVYLASLGDAIVAIDREWNITLWNNAAATMTGWSADEAIGRPFREKIRFLREHDRKENIAFIEEAFLFGATTHLSDDTVLVTRSGKEIPISDSAAPILDPNGKATGVIIVFRDDTVERESRILRTDFAYASHQLRTPITKALWSLEAVEEETTGDVRKKVETARRAVLDMQKMSERLLEVSSIDQQTVFAKPQPVSVMKVVEDAVTFCAHEAEARQVRIVTHNTPATVTIETDGTLLRRALEEVILNAVLYSPPRAVIDIQALVQTSDLLIEIRDTGIGVSEEQQALVFTKFFRGQNVPSDVSGVGLGLFIVREYLKILGGRVWFVSELGRGTTFSIAIPISKSQQHEV